MKLLITGSTGYIGAHLSKYLSEKNFEVFGTARNPQINPKNWAPKIRDVFFGDITSDSLFEKLKLYRFDAIIHTVSLNHNYGEDHRQEAFDVGVNSTQKLLELAKSVGTTRFIYFSTQQVYGPFKADALYSEDSPANPSSVYALTHLTAENICKKYSSLSGIKTISLRLSNALGKPIIPSAHIDSLVANDLCRMAKENGEIRLKSDGTPQRNFILISDICVAVEKLLKLDSWPHSMVNLGSPTTISLAELAMQISKEAGNVSVYLADGSRLTNVEKFMAAKKFVFPIERLKDFGVVPKADLKDGIRDLLS